MQEKSDLAGAPACDYGHPRARFRGPECDFRRRHIAYLGGRETMGRFMGQPFSVMVEQATGYGALNLGQNNAGVEFFARFQGLDQLTRRASHVVIEISSAALQSNRYYRVHPVRNDRITSISEECGLGEAIGDAHFIRHFLSTAAQDNPHLFTKLRRHLAAHWVLKMQNLIAQFQVPVHLLWFSPKSPDNVSHAPLAADPLFVDRTMLNALWPHVENLIEVPLTHQTRVEEDPQLEFTVDQAAAAGQMLGQAAHYRATRAIVDSLRKCDSKQKRPA